MVELKEIKQIGGGGRGAKIPIPSHQTFQTVANVVSTAAAVAALWYSANIYQNTVRTDSENQAKVDWSNYLELAASNPNFTDGVSYESLVDLFENNKANEYSLYQKRMLFYFDNILLSSKQQKWRRMINSELRRHGSQFCLPSNIATMPDGPRSNFSESSNGRYSPELVSLVDEIIEDCPEFRKPK